MLGKDVKNDVLRITTVSVSVSVSVRYCCTVSCDEVWSVFNTECPHRASYILLKMAGDHNKKLQQKQQKMEVEEKMVDLIYNFW